MAKIFYCGGSSGQLGILRAVIPASNLCVALSDGRAKYMGKSFPKMKQESPCITVIEIAREEKEARCKPGFYRAAKSPLDFEEHLRELVNGGA